MDWLTSIPICHRGLHDNNKGIPENSLLAFKASVEANFPIELDLQLLSDGEIAVFHDSFLTRMTGQKGNIHKKSKDQIRKLKLLNTDESIPLLSELLELVNGKVPLLMELKGSRNIGEFENAFIKLIKVYKGKYAVESFNPFTIRWFRENAPQIKRGQLYGGIRGRRFFTRLSKPDFAVFDIRHIPLNVLSKFKEKKLPAIGYTVKSSAEMHNALQLLDNIIFEGFLP